MKVMTVNKQLTDGLWIVVDTLDRKYKVSGDGDWKKGDRVAVISDRIVGRTGKQTISATYQV